MRSTTLSTLRRKVLSTYRPRSLSRSAIIRSSSSEARSLESALHSELTSRPATKIVDHLTHTSWNLLNTALADFLPESCDPPDFNREDISSYKGSDGSGPYPSLPQGHHLVYFPPPIFGNSLLADGTDSLHSPGPPFVRRLWAGGSLVFNAKEKSQLVMTKIAALCLEDIADVKVKGNEGEEKVFVTVRRKLGIVDKRLKKLLNGEEKNIVVDPSGVEDLGAWALIEKRTLVFMREKSAEEAQEDLEKVGRVILPKDVPDFSVTLTPNAALLFRFSALTFNAHRIHLDPQYAREVEGHRNLLVHGPLSLVLMLSVLRSQLREGEIILNFDYRNLAPLYVDEEMKICVKRNSEKFDVWIEGKEGGYAVKGMAVVGHIEKKAVKPVVTKESETALEPAHTQEPEAQEPKTAHDEPLPMTS